jgi:uncharacterized iron-regulated membrane protein
VHRRLHLCIGGLLSVPLVMIGLSGSVLVFAPELQKLAAPDFGVASAGPAQPLAAIVAAAQAEAPQGTVPSLVVAPATDQALAETRFADPSHPGPGGTQVFVDPTTLVVRGTVASGDGILREIFFIHANLAMHDRGARTIVGWLGVAMCVLGVSGLIMQWPTRRRWRAALTITPGARGYRLLRQLHGVVGFWFFLVFFIVSFTGVWLSFPQSFNAAAASWLGIRDLRPSALTTKVVPVADMTPLDVDGAVALARTTAPNALLRSVALPTRPDQPYRVDLLRSPGATLPLQITVDPWRRHILDRSDPATYSWVERVIASMHAIHEGSVLAWPWRILVFASGLLPAFFAVSGIAMWLVKRRARRSIVARPGAVLGAMGD